MVFRQPKFILIIAVENFTQMVLVPKLYMKRTDNFYTNFSLEMIISHPLGNYELNRE